MPIIIITWHTAHDDRVCKICNAIDGYNWIFVVGKDVMTDALIHPMYGIVWSMSQGSNAHARGYGSGQLNNCRCQISYQLFVEDILAKCVFLREVVQETANSFDYIKGGSRKTTFEDIGVDPGKYGF
jgi:hypothetical protein